jgi:hypothetical protein
VPLILLPGQRHDARLARIAMAAAVALTGLGFAAVLTAIARRTPVRAALVTARPAAERVTLVTVPPLARATRVRSMPAPPHLPTPRPAAPRAVPVAIPDGAGTAGDSAPSAPGGVPIGATVAGGSATPGGTAHAGAGGSPVFRGASPFARTRALTPAERDRAAWDAGFRASWMGPARQPTAAETDSLARQESWRVREWLEQDRPVPMPIGGAGVPLPGGGPTREQRKRDSVTNAGNVARLRKIEGRTRRDSDSARVVP